jgi:Arm DNA-binding domain
MPDTRLALTDRSIGGLPFAVSSQYFARDTELAGFAVLVGKRRKTFVVQGDIRKGKQRLSIRLKVGAVGEKTTREARAEAKELLGKIAKGIDPREKNPQLDVAEPQPGGISTLRQAWQRYQDAHVVPKGLSGTTIKNYRDHVERLMADWLDQPLSVLGLEPNLVASRHDKITREQGPYLANGCMRTLRAIYNHARKTARQLPAENPVSAVDWNQEKRRDTGLRAMILCLVLGFSQLRAPAATWPNIRRLAKHWRNGGTICDRHTVQLHKLPALRNSTFICS